MKDIYEELGDLCETIEHEIRDANEKIKKANGKMSAGDLEYIDKLTHAMKSIKTTMAMIDAEDSTGYSNARYYNDEMGGGSYARRYSRDNSYNDGSYNSGSYARGRGTYAKRDSMGRYSSEGYSRASEDMIRELEDLMHDAPDEGTRVKFQSFIEEMRRR